MKEIATVSITHSTKPRPIFACENETKANLFQTWKLIKVKEKEAWISHAMTIQ